MSFAIKSTNSNLPPLIFGSFRGDIDSMFKSEGDWFINPFPVDEIAELGTDLVPIHDSLTKGLVYPSPDPNRYLYIAEAAASVGIYYHKVKPFANGGVAASFGDPSGVYLMLNTPSFDSLVDNDTRLIASWTVFLSKTISVFDTWGITLLTLGYLPSIIRVVTLPPSHTNLACVSLYNNVNDLSLEYLSKL